MTSHASLRSRRSSRTVSVALLVVIGAIVGLAGPASAASYNVTFSGVVSCSTSSNAVQGVWVQNYDGSDGWASWTAFPERLYAATYSITVTSSRPDPNVRLDVGCGRNEDGSWKKTVLTPDFRTRHGYTETRKCDDTAANRSRACTPAPLGQTRSTNPGYAGYCTWGAAKKWKDYTGSYPNLSGDAYLWYQSARDRGFRTSSVPQPRSIFVKGAVTGTSPGHVGWVIKVRISGSTVYFDTIEMNGGSGGTAANDWQTSEFNAFANKTRTWTASSDYRFIVAPT